MRARLIPCSNVAGFPPVPVGHHHTLMARILRGTLAVLGLSWICFASTLCGCNSVNGYVMNESGKAYYRRGDYTAARHEFERALMDSPENANYAHNVAAAMQQQGDVMAAEKMYQHALVIDPGHQQSYEGLAHLLYNNDRTGEAEQLLMAWSETQPYDEAASLSLARMQENMGNGEAADMAYHRALAANPTSSRVHRELGHRRRRAGRHDSELAFQPGVMQNPYAAGMQSGAQSPALLMAQQMPLYDPTFQPAVMPFANYGPGSGYGATPPAPYIGSANLAQQSPPSIYQGIRTPSTATLQAPSIAWGTPATVPMPPSELNAGGMLAGQPAYAPPGAAFFSGPQAPAWSAPIAATPMMSPPMMSAPAMAPTMMAPQFAPGLIAPGQFAPGQVMPASGVMPMSVTPSSYGGQPAPPPLPQTQVVPAF